MSAVLVIAGTDPGGGAGLLRDVCTLQQLGVAALCAVTAVTVQSDQEIAAIHALPSALVSAQIAAALATGRVSAVKMGMLASRATVLQVADCLPPREDTPIVLDPVLAASSGGMLLEEQGRQALLEQLLPRVTLLTPNIPEAAALLRTAPATEQDALVRQAQALLALGPLAVLLKGGHGAGAESVDYLVRAGRPPLLLRAARSRARLRGTGCALAAGVAAGLARGLSLEDACALAKHHVTESLQQLRAS